MHVWILDSIDELRFLSNKKKMTSSPYPYPYLILTDILTFIDTPYPDPSPTSDRTDATIKYDAIDDAFCQLTLSSYEAVSLACA
jgi:hypothetical protein